LHLQGDLTNILKMEASGYSVSPVTVLKMETPDLPESSVDTY